MTCVDSTLLTLHGHDEGDGVLKRNSTRQSGSGSGMDNSSNKDKVHAGDTRVRQGDVFLGKYAVCDNGWVGQDDVDDNNQGRHRSNKAAHVVCNQLFGKEFESRNGKVPMFKATADS